VGGGLSQLTIRITAEQLRYLQSPECGPGNPNELIRRLIEDARTFLGLPAPLVERLASDAKQMGLDLSRYEERREYLANLCALRYEQLLTGQVPPPDRPVPPAKTKGKS
jgi:hypothetical protein